MAAMIPVALVHIPSYERKMVIEGVCSLLEGLEFHVPRSSHVLVKPNLITPLDPLAVTTPEFVRAVCTWFIDQGAHVSVGDSPAFGSAFNAAQRTGLFKALKGLDLQFVELDEPRKVLLPSGIMAGISAKALETDFIINCPRLKAHIQMGVTAAVKNLFGCVSGFRKAFAHYRYGDVSNKFESLILDLIHVLPSGISIVDGIVAMDTTGPSGGNRCGLGFAGASTSPVAMDTVIYSMLEVSPAILPLHREAVRRGIRGSSRKHIKFLLDPPGTFDFSEFRAPLMLHPVTFNPLRLLKGRLESLFMRLY